MSTQAQEWFVSDNIPEERRKEVRTVDMRYAGQNYELSVPVPAGPITLDTFKQLEEGFEAVHKQRFGFIAKGEKIQLVTLRLEAIGEVKKAQLQSYPFDGPSADAAKIGERDVWLASAGDFVTSPVYDRKLLKHGNQISGPAIIEQMDTTSVILPEMTATVDANLNLIVEIAQ